jgi:hypothetical protein
MEDELRTDPPRRALSRRTVLKGAAATSVAAGGSLYVKPGLRHIGVPGALAQVSGTPSTPEPTPTSEPTGSVTVTVTETNATDFTILVAGSGLLPNSLVTVAFTATDATTDTFSFLASGTGSIDRTFVVPCGTLISINVLGTGADGSQITFGPFIPPC